MFDSNNFNPFIQVFFAKGFSLSVVFKYMEFFRDVENIILEGIVFCEGIFSCMSLFFISFEKGKLLVYFLNTASTGCHRGAPARV